MTAPERTPPAFLSLIADNLPLDDLRPYPHFVAWEPEWREGKDGKPGAWTKVPKNPRTGLNAKSTVPATWGAADDVLSSHDRIGFEVAADDPFGFLDLDNALDAAGDRKPWAREIVARFPTYWEISPSGRGLKGLIRATGDRNRIIKIGDGQAEVFFSGKYTTLTGHRLPDATASISDCQEALDCFLAEFSPEPEPRAAADLASLDLDDQEIVTRILRTEKGRRLYEAGDLSDYDDDHSAGDQGLCNFCVSAGATGPAQIDRIVRSSALMRDKWDRDDYRERTIDKALDGTVVPWDGWDRAPAATIVHSVAAAPASQSLGFAPGPCADRVAALEAENAALRAAVAERDELIARQAARIDTLKTVQLATNRIIGNKSHGPTRVVAAVVATEIAWRATAETPKKEQEWQVPFGTMAISLGRIARRAGVSVNTASSHLQTLEDRGLLRKETKTVKIRAGDVKDPETGELYTEDDEGYVTQLFIGPANITPINAQAAVDLSNDLANYSSQRTENRGGKRTPRCPEHPDAKVIREFVDRCSVPGCKRQLNKGEVELPPMLLGPPETPPAPEATESQTLGVTQSAVADRLYTPQTLGFAQESPPQHRPGRAFVAAGPPASFRSTSTPPDRCLDCGAKIPLGTHYCVRHGGSPPPDRYTDVAYGTPA